MGCCGHGVIAAMMRLGKKRRNAMPMTGQPMSALESMLTVLGEADWFQYGKIAIFILF